MLGGEVAMLQAARVLRRVDDSACVRVEVLRPRRARRRATATAAAGVKGEGPLDAGSAWRNTDRHE
jgi:hypothetical protein